MSMAKGLSRSLRGSLRSGVSSILFVLLYGQPPCLAYAARSKRRRVAQPVERLSTASVVPGSYETGARQTASQHTPHPASLLRQRAHIIERSHLSRGCVPNFSRPAGASSKLDVSAYAQQREPRECAKRIGTINTSVANKCQRRSVTPGQPSSTRQHCLSVLFSGRPRDAAFVSPDAQRTPQNRRATARG